MKVMKLQDMMSRGQPSTGKVKHRDSIFSHVEWKVKQFQCQIGLLGGVEDLSTVAEQIGAVSTRK
jgi:hypothetical protein